MRAKSANEKVIEDFFAKLAAVLARLNITYACVQCRRNWIFKGA
jgi:hypothetical protein